MGVLTLSREDRASRVDLAANYAVNHVALFSGTAKVQVKYGLMRAPRCCHLQKPWSRPEAWLAAGKRARLYGLVQPPALPLKMASESPHQTDRRLCYMRQPWCAQAQESQPGYLKSRSIKHKAAIFAAQGHVAGEIDIDSATVQERGF